MGTALTFFLGTVLTGDSDHVPNGRDSWLAQGGKQQLPEPPFYFCSVLPDYSLILVRLDFPQALS